MTENRHNIDFRNALSLVSFVLRFRFTFRSFRAYSSCVRLRGDFYNFVFSPVFVWRYLKLQQERVKHERVLGSILSVSTWFSSELTLLHVCDVGYLRWHLAGEILFLQTEVGTHYVWGFWNAIIDSSLRLTRCGLGSWPGRGGIFLV